MASDESKFEEFQEVIKEKIAKNKLSKEEAFAFYGYFFALMDYEMITLEELGKLQNMMSISNQDIMDFSF